MRIRPDRREQWTSPEDGAARVWGTCGEETRAARCSETLLHLGVGELDALLDAALELRQCLLHELLLVLTQLAEPAEALDAVALHAHAEPS